MRMKSVIGLILRVVVAVTSLLFIGIKVHRQLSDGLPSGFSDMSAGPLLVAIALVPVNWLVETFKWQRLTAHLQQLPILQAAKSVLSGLAVSMLTPNRIGDFAGRITTLNPGNRTAGAMAAFAGGYAQMLAIAMLGVFAFCLKPVLPDFLLWTSSCRVLTMTVLIVAIVVLVAIYFFAGETAAKFKFTHWPWLEKFVSSAGQHTKAQLATTLALSFIRSGVFMTQLWLMLDAAGVKLDVCQAFNTISIMYCFVSIVPTFALAEWGVRGSMALLFIAPLGGNTSQILAATIVLWLINVAVPATIGAIWGTLPAKQDKC